MRILLDTHIFLWYINADTNNLTEERLQVLRQPENEIFLSVVSLWEIIIKYQLDKLPLPQSPELYIPQKRRLHTIESLPVGEADVARLIKLPHHHRDPFDRLLICQAIEHNMILATVDNAIQAYAVITM